MSVTHITGVEDTLRFFDKQPANAKSIVQKAMRAGGKAGAKQLKNSVPGRWKALPRSKVGINARNEIWCRFGMYNNHVAQGHQPKAYRGNNAKEGIEDWFKFYWQNYGTLKHRDRSHDFVYPIKNKKNRRNEEGQKHTNVYDRAVDNAKKAFAGAFESAVEKNKDELLKR